ncbi:MAG TPA: LacI family DNA-binding transcriptional regulator [Acidobacteriaceae bacterium]|nr:LacI family DNA-binding transcriptional regulator [Acidobacteriaceae bacterium]
MITIRDIAKATGLSTATVSMVLNKAGRRIPPVTQRLVEETAHKLGYFPNLQARSLRSNRTHSIGVLVFDITDPYCGLVIRGIENSLEAAGFMSVLADLQNTPKRLHRCLQMLMGRRVEGIIAIANPVQLGTELSAALTQFKIPGVSIGSQPESKRYSSVTIDNVAGARAAVEHLCNLGHRNIAVIKGPKAMTDSAPRWQGIREYARKKRMQIDPSLVVEIGGSNSSYQEGYDLTKGLMQTGKRFSALIAFDDLTAFAAIGALSSAGIRVPEDCSVVGFDDIPGAAYYNPPLTTICQRLEEQGMLSAEIMQRQLSSQSAQTRNKVQKQIEPHLVIRQSTARVPTQTR